MSSSSSIRRISLSASYSVVPTPGQVEHRARSPEPHGRVLLLIQEIFKCIDGSCRERLYALDASVEHHGPRVRLVCPERPVIGEPTPERSFRDASTLGSRRQ